MADEFMIVSGMPEIIGQCHASCNEYSTDQDLWLLGENHVSEIAEMALDLLAGSVVFQVPNKPNKNINLRMGFHRFIIKELVINHVNFILAEQQLE